MCDIDNKCNTHTYMHAKILFESKEKMMMSCNVPCGMCYLIGPLYFIIPTTLVRGLLPEYEEVW